jgi:hypothetical protein
VNNAPCRFALFMLASLFSAAGGCGSNRLPVAPAEGKIIHQGQPLAFGSVMFQPTKGPPARGVIQPDGSFRLSTYGDNDGAVIGSHRVRVACFESQKPSSGGNSASKEIIGLGRSLIPERYSNLETSGLRVEVKAANEPFVLDLSNN